MVLSPLVPRAAAAAALDAAVGGHVRLREHGEVHVEGVAFSYVHVEAPSDETARHAEDVAAAGALA